MICQNDTRLERAELEALIKELAASREHLERLAGRVASITQAWNPKWDNERRLSAIEGIFVFVLLVAIWYLIAGELFRSREILSMGLFVAACVIRLRMRKLSFGPLLELIAATAFGVLTTAWLEVVSSFVVNHQLPALPDSSTWRLSAGVLLALVCGWYAGLLWRSASAMLEAMEDQSEASPNRGQHATARVISTRLEVYKILLVPLIPVVIAIINAFLASK